MLELHPEFLSKDGKKEFAVIPYEEFLQLQEMLEDFERLKRFKISSRRRQR